MAPVGSRESLAAAIQAGADSIYFGIENLNMRARSANTFTVDDLREIAQTCDEHGMKSYLTVNTIIYDKDIPLMRTIVDAAKAAGISAVIAADVAVMNYARQIGQEVHLSTQLNISNAEALKFYAQFADIVECRSPPVRIRAAMASHPFIPIRIVYPYTITDFANLVLPVQRSDNFMGI